MASWLGGGGMVGWGGSADSSNMCPAPSSEPQLLKQALAGSMASSAKPAPPLCTPTLTGTPIWERQRRLKLGPDGWGGGASGDPLPNCPKCHYWGPMEGWPDASQGQQPLFVAVAGWAAENALWCLTLPHLRNHPSHHTSKVPGGRLARPWSLPPGLQQPSPPLREPD